MYGNDGGLWLVKSDDKNGRWILRVYVYGRRREMGLCTFPRVSLKDVRVEAETWRKVAMSGKDPIKQRETDHRDVERKLHILRDVVDDAFERHKISLKGNGKAGR